MCWLPQFRPPQNVHADRTFDQEPFMTMLNPYGVSKNPVLSLRHQNYMIDPRHCVIRSIFLRIKQNVLTSKGPAMQAIRISNDLFCNDRIYPF